MTISIFIAIFQIHSNSLFSCVYTGEANPPVAHAVVFRLHNWFRGANQELEFRKGLGYISRVPANDCFEDVCWALGASLYKNGGLEARFEYDQLLRALLHNSCDGVP